MGAKRCSVCGLVNPSSALRCDCGYDFHGKFGQALDLRKPGQRTSGIDSISAFWWTVIGLTISILLAGARIALRH
jgi:hypothetical protein